MKQIFEERILKTSRKSFALVLVGVMCCSLLHLSTSVFQQFSILIRFLPIWLDACSLAQPEEECSSHYSWCGIFTPQNCFLLQFFIQQTFLPYSRLVILHLKLIRVLKNKLLCQLVCCCFISMPSRCNFSRIFCCSTKLFCRTARNFCFADCFSPSFPICGVWHFEGSNERREMLWNLEN